MYEDSNGNGTIDSGDLLITTQTNNGSGIYNFTGLNTTRSYIVQAATADPDIAGYFTTTYGSSANQLTSTNPRAVASGFTTVTNADFGFWRSLPATIGDQVFADYNFNGIYDAGDVPLGNVNVQLYDSTGTVLLTTVSTDASGIYSLTGLAAGTYVVKMDTLDTDIPSGFSSSVLSHSATVAAGDNFLTADFPFIAVFGKSVDLASASPGNLLNYNMFPYWPGPSLLTGAKVMDAVPAGTTFVSAGQGGTAGEDPPSSTSGVPGSHPGSSGSGSATLTATKDTSINSAAQTLNYGASTTLIESREGGNTVGARAILAQFDLSSIPAGATISGAQFKMTKISTNDPNVTYQIYPLLKAWTEGTGLAAGTAGAASYNLRQAGTAWRQPLRRPRPRSPPRPAPSATPAQVST